MLIYSIHFLGNSGEAILAKALIICPEIVTEPAPAVLILMTIDTEIFPVRAIGGIIPAVSIPMMNGQKMPVSIFKLSSAFGANEPVLFKGLLPVTG